MCCSPTHLCPAAAGPINSAGGTVRKSEGKTALDCGDSGNSPSIEDFSLSSLMRPKGQIILVVHNKAMRPVPAARPVLLVLIQWVIGIRTVPRAKRGIHSRQQIYGKRSKLRQTFCLYVRRKAVVAMPSSLYSRLSGGDMPR